MGLLKKIGKGIGKLFPGTGRHAATRAANEADVFAAQAAQQRSEIEERTKREKKKAQKLAIRGLRSRRAASHFASPDNTYQSYGSPTIG